MASNREKQKAIPDLYKLLKLKPLESDVSEIQAAIELVKAKATQQLVNAKGDEQQLAVKRLRKITALAESNLLRQDRKTAYDAKWRKLFSTASTNERAADWDWELLTPFLPSGDPSAPFNLSEYLSQTPEPDSSEPEAEFAQLMAMLSPGGEDSALQQAKVFQADGPATATLVATPITAGSVNATAANLNGAHIESSIPQAGQLPNTTAMPVSSLASKIRRKRAFSTVLVVGGAMVSLVALISLILFVLKGQQGNLTAASGAGDVDSEPMPRVKERITAPQGSGLPSVTGLDNAPPMQAGNEVAEPEATLRPPENSVIADNMPAMPAQDDSVPMVEISEATEAVLSDEELASWNNAMKGIGTLLAQQDYEASANEFAKLSEQAKVEFQKEQLHRITTAANLAEEFQSALSEAILGLKAGETFLVGSQTEVSFVGQDDSGVTLRVFGSNQTYLPTQMRMGVVTALAAMKLDLEHPNSKAMQACFMRFHPTVRDLQAARDLMRQAISEGVIFEEMNLLFDDVYE